jgi:hypothetical protein
LQLLYNILLDHVERLDQSESIESSSSLPAPDRNIYVHMNDIEGIMAESAVVGTVPLLRKFGFTPLKNQHQRSRLTNSNMRRSDDNLLVLPESAEEQLRSGLSILQEQVQQLPRSPPASPKLAVAHSGLTLSSLSLASSSSSSSSWRSASNHELLVLSSDSVQDATTSSLRDSGDRRRSIAPDVSCSVQSGSLLQRSSSGTAIWRDWQCSRCQAPIEGVAFVCANCPLPLFVLCVLCERDFVGSIDGQAVRAQVPTERVHNLRHVFMKLRRPPSTEAQALWQPLPNIYAEHDSWFREEVVRFAAARDHRIRCHSCFDTIKAHQRHVRDTNHQSPIDESAALGFRYLCINCNLGGIGFNLCAACEQTQAHSPTHAMLKISVPLPLPYYVTQLYRPPFFSLLDLDCACSNDVPRIARDNDDQVYHVCAVAERPELLLALCGETSVETLWQSWQSLMHVGLDDDAVLLQNLSFVLCTKIIGMYTLPTCSLEVMQHWHERLVRSVSQHAILAQPLCRAVQLLMSVGDAAASQLCTFNSRREIVACIVRLARSTPECCAVALETLHGLTQSSSQDIGEWLVECGLLDVVVERLTQDTEHRARSTAWAIANNIAAFSSESITCRLLLAPTLPSHSPNTLTRVPTVQDLLLHVLRDETNAAIIAYAASILSQAIKYSAHASVSDTGAAAIVAKSLDFHRAELVRVLHKRYLFQSPWITCSTALVLARLGM